MEKDASLSQKLKNKEIKRNIQTGEIGRKKKTWTVVKFSDESRSYLKKKFPDYILQGKIPPQVSIFKMQESPNCTDSVKKAHYKKIRDTVRNIGTRVRRQMEFV